MAIEITEFADVSISVSPVGVQGGNFGILGFLTNDEDVSSKPIRPAERARAYTSLASVGGDWGTTTEVYKAATAFYGQTPTPRDFTVLMAYKNAQAASLVGGGAATEQELISADWNTTGTLSMSIDGNAVAVTDLDLSGDATYSEMATTIETAINANGGSGITVTHNGYQFVVTGLTTGVTGLMSVATGTAAEDLGLLSYQSKVSDGVDAETPVDGLAACLAAGIQWVGTVTNAVYRDKSGQAVGEDTLAIAQWCEAAKRIFCNTTNDLTTLVAASSADVASKLKLASLRYSLTTFSRNPAQYPSASVFGRAASTNFSAIGTTITLNLKQMPGVTSEDLTPAEFAALRGKNASAVVVIGSSINAYTDSRMASGSWLDTTHGLMWLEDRCETDLFNLMYVSNTKVPFTQTGINTTVAVLERSLQAAVRNGLAGPGFLADGTFLPEGFKVSSVPLEDVPAGDVGNRIYKGLSFVMKGAGALHEVEVAGSFTE